MCIVCTYKYVCFLAKNLFSYEKINIHNSKKFYSISIMVFLYCVYIIYIYIVKCIHIILNLWLILFYFQFRIVLQRFNYITQRAIMD